MIDEDRPRTVGRRHPRNGLPSRRTRPALPAIAYREHHLSLDRFGRKPRPSPSLLGQWLARQRRRSAAHDPKVPAAAHRARSRPRLSAAHASLSLDAPPRSRRRIGRRSQDCWSVAGSLSDLPDNPIWIINATCYEAGKNWRFMKKHMGDYVTGYVSSPRLPIAQAVVASVAVPGLLGSLKLDTRRFEWFAYDRGSTPRPHAPRFRTLTLWDGGVYDKLGVEALFKPAGAYSDGFYFLVVSDASAAPVAS